MKIFLKFLVLTVLGVCNSSRGMGLLGGAQFTLYDYYTEQDRNQPTAFSLLKTDLSLLGQFYSSGGSGISIPLNIQFLGDRTYLTSIISFDWGLSLFNGYLSLGLGPGIEYNLTGINSIKYIWSIFLGYEVDKVFVKLGLNSFAPMSQTQKTLSPFLGIFWRFQ